MIQESPWLKICLVIRKKEITNPASARVEDADHNTEQENKSRIDFDNKVGDKVLVRKDAILCKNQG